MSLKMVWKRGLSLILLAGAFALGLPHCGVEGNPFYLSADPSRVRPDVADAPSSDIVTDTATDTEAEDHVVVTDVTQVTDGTDTADVTDAAEAADATDATDVIMVADVLDEQMLADLVTVDAPDVPVFADAADVISATDVIDAADAVDATDVIMDTPDVVDVVLAMDVVDVPPAVDRPDVVIGMDTTDVVMTPDRPDAVQPDIPPPPPEFVVEYVRDYGNNSVPGPGEQVSVIGVAFYAENRWTRYDLVASRFASSPDRYRATIPVLSSSQRAALSIALSLPEEGCGSRIQMGCPMGWQLHWAVTRLGRSYYGNTTTIRGDASVPVMEHIRYCTDYGFPGTECVVCLVAP